MNQLWLQASVVERAARRFTPAGLPALDVRLAHASQVEHAGQQRKVMLELPATALGEVVQQVERLSSGEVALFKGFLGPQRNGRGVVLHISAVETPYNVPESH